MRRVFVMLVGSQVNQIMDMVALRNALEAQEERTPDLIDRGPGRQRSDPKLKAVKETASDDEDDVHADLNKETPHDKQLLRE